MGVLPRPVPCVDAGKRARPVPCVGVRVGPSNVCGAGKICPIQFPVHI